MIEWMFAIGGKSLYYGDQDVVNQLLEDVDIGNRRALEAADAVRLIMLTPKRKNCIATRHTSWNLYSKRGYRKKYGKGENSCC